MDHKTEYVVVHVNNGEGNSGDQASNVKLGDICTLVDKPYHDVWVLSCPTWKGNVGLHIDQIRVNKR